MTLDDLRRALLAKPGAEETYPFGPETMVIKVGGKMFALIAHQAQPLTISLKCDPVNAQFLRDTYPAVQPGYHLNKQHWNSITLDGSVPENELQAMIDESYLLVFAGLTKATRQRIAG